MSLSLTDMKDLVPHENLYKLASIFGLVLAITGIVLWWSAYRGVADAWVDAVVGWDEVTLQSQRVEDALERLEVNLEHHDEDVYQRLRAQTEAALSKYVDLGAQMGDTYPDLARAKRKFDISTRWLGVLIGGGGGVSALGFYLWYSRIQRYADIQAKLDGLRAAREIAALER